MALVVNTTNVVNSDRSFTLGTATPGSPVTGMIRYNSGAGVFEVYNGTAWVNMIGISSTPLWSWGTNVNGELGDNTTVNKSSPVSVVGGFTDWVQISLGRNHTTAIRANGTAYSWGLGSLGRLGDNTTVSKSSPVLVAGGFTDWLQVSLGRDHTAAVRANGTAYCWGLATFGRLGDNTTVNKSSPVLVAGGFTDWVQISAGDHTAAVRANGTAYCWGNGNFGRLGNNATTDRSSPVLVVGGFTNWVQIAAGAYHTAAIRANGTAYCWGNGQNGRLGDNTSVSKSSPVLVVGGFTDWVQISTQIFHTAAVRANGTAYCWGVNTGGRLGDNTVVEKSSPVLVLGGITDWVQTSCGTNHTAAIRANGTAYAWGGSNSDGRLGDNTTVNKSSPVLVAGGFTDWVQISAGDHTVAIRSG
jgi:alpha-tubulin suppressor-like RCC1 family protein